MMKILFVVHEIDFADHIAIAHLSSIAKQLGQLTFFCSLDHSDLPATVGGLKPDVVAYSVNIMGYRAIVEAHKRAMRVSNFISIMGGPHPTYSPETFSESGMDAYCIGEGEYPFRDFLIRVEQGEPFDDIENLITKEKANPVRPLIRNLDELPPADRDLTISNSLLKDAPKKTFYATRGCPFACAYCSNNYYRKLYKGKGPLVRRFSVDRLIQEIERVKGKYRMDFVKFGDDVFVPRASDWLVEFAEKYSKRVGVPFNCYLRLDTIDDDLLRLLRQAGCFSVHLSADSTSWHVREHILRRHMQSENIVERLRKIREHGINTYVNFMLAAPESTLQDDLDAIRMCKEGRVTYPSFSTTVPMKGTDLYNYCVEHGFIDPQTHKSDMAGCLEKSTLSCFSEHEKKVRYNVYLLGSVIAKIPFPWDKLAMALIKTVPPNRLFKRVRKWVYQYYITNKIYKLPKEKLWK